MRPPQDEAFESLPNCRRSELVHEQPAIVERGGMVRLDCERPVVARKRLLEPPQELQRKPAIVQRDDVMGRNRQHPVVIRKGILRPLECEHRVAAVVKHLDLARIDGKCLVIGCQRLFKPPLAMQGEAASVERSDVVGRFGQSRRAFGKLDGEPIGGSPVLVRRDDLVQVCAHVHPARDTEHIDRNHAAENVLLFTEMVARVEQPRQMPEQAVIAFEQGADQLRRFFPSVVLDIKERPAAGEGFCRAGKDLPLHPFHVDLDEIALRESQRIEGRDADILAQNPGAPFLLEPKASEVAVLSVIHHWNKDAIGPGAQRPVNGGHVAQCIEREIAAQDMIESSLRLE
jgi:hypothetical protein